ncbi:MAG: hypothetical protein AB8F78_04855 [Saprospiraceae bacterium]
MDYQERLNLIDTVSTRLTNGEREEALEAELSETLYGKDVKDILFQASKEIKTKTKISVRKILLDSKSIEDIKNAHPNISDGWIDDAVRGVKMDSFHELKTEIVTRIRRGDKQHTWTNELSHPCLTQEEIEVFSSQLVAKKMETKEVAEKSAKSGLIIACVGIAISLGSIIYAASSGGGGRIFYGAIFGGLYMAYKGFTSQD